MGTHQVREEKIKEVKEAKAISKLDLANHKALQNHAESKNEMAKCENIIFLP